MGFSLDFIPFFDKCHARQRLSGPFLSLGSQEIHSPAQEIIEFAQSNGYAQTAQDRSFKSLLHERYGISEYADCDINGLAALDWDLSRPVAENEHGKWRVIYDGGTLEHIFNIAQVFINIHALCALGGIIVHTTPVSWLAHGFYNFTPKIFQSIGAANGYTQIASAWYLTPQNGKNGQRQGKRSEFCGKERAAPSGLLALENGSLAEPVVIPEEIVNNGLLPVNLMYCLAYQKTKAQAFVQPVEIGY